MPPLVIWGVAIGAEELLTLAGVLTVGAAITAQQSIQAGSRAHIDLGTTTQVCTTCDPDPCQQLSGKIKARQDELTKRFQDMREDKLGLFTAGTAGLPGAGSWAGHVRQFEDKQKNLRSMLNDFASRGCGSPPTDAWKDASRSAPTQPAPK